MIFAIFGQRLHISNDLSDFLIFRKVLKSFFESGQNFALISPLLHKNSLGLGLLGHPGDLLDEAGHLSEGLRTN